jgi:hypothetical protein
VVNKFLHNEFPREFAIAAAFLLVSSFAAKPRYAAVITPM